jgi:hypothetical protein
MHFSTDPSNESARHTWKSQSYPSSTQGFGALHGSKLDQVAPGCSNQLEFPGAQAEGCTKHGSSTA